MDSPKPRDGPLTNTYAGGPVKQYKWDYERSIREGAALALIFTLVNAYRNPPMTNSWAGYAGATSGIWIAYFIIWALFCFVVNRYMARAPLKRRCLGNLVRCLGNLVRMMRGKDD